jgi:adenylate cyclase
VGVNPVAPGPPLPTGRKVFRTLAKSYALITASTSAVGMLLAVPVADFTFWQALVGGIMLAASALIFVFADIVAIRVQSAPLRRYLDGKDTGEAAAQAAFARALDLPWLGFWRILLVHLPLTLGPFVGLLLAVGNPIFWANIDSRRLVMISVMVPLLASWHALFEYLLLLRVTRPWAEALYVRLGPQVAQKVVLRGVRQRLLLVCSGLVVIPLGCSSALLLVRVWPALELMEEGLWPLTLTALGVGAVSAAGCMLVVRLLAGATTQPLEELTRAMRAVALGNFSPRLAVTQADEFATVAQCFNDMTSGLAERERLRDAFGRYLSPEVAQAVMKEAPRLGGETVEATVLFADIRGFTGLSERLSPPEIVQLLNGYFSAVEPAIQGAGGWINKFGGDSLLAVFGVPQRRADHAACAVNAALALRAALAAFNAAQRAADRPEIGIGIGIHTGQMVAGNVGSPGRLEYTVIGDAVNAAARLQSLTREHGVDVLLSADAFGAAGLDVPAESVGQLPLRGRKEPLEVLALGGGAASTAPRNAPVRRAG